jgi:hypothetical protein
MSSAIDSTILYLEYSLGYKGCIAPKLGSKIVLAKLVSATREIV